VFTVTCSTILHLAPALLVASAKVTCVRVRITERPREPDIDGVKLDRMQPGTVREVSSAVGTWLIVKGYAYPEMRRSNDDPDAEKESPGLGVDRRQR
jgi:hypothetical protein